MKNIVALCSLAALLLAPGCARYKKDDQKKAPAKKTEVKKGDMKKAAPAKPAMASGMANGAKKAVNGNGANAGKAAMPKY